MTDTRSPDRPRADAGASAAGSRLRLAVPVLIFAAIAIMFGLALRKGDPSKLPSALIGKPAPALALAPIEGVNDGPRAVPLLTSQSLAGGATVVNFWASWCLPCVEEHPLLVALARRPGVRIVGINYKDSAANARRFLGHYGNPFAAIGADGTGRTAIEWGVYGMPETFLVDAAGRVAFKHVGPLTPEIVEKALLPAIERARAAPGGARPK